MTDPNVPMDRKKIQKGTGIAGNVATTLTVPAGERWFLTNVTVILTTDATVKNRNAQIFTRDSAATTIFKNASNSVAASQTNVDKYFIYGLSSTGVSYNALGYNVLDPTDDLYITIYNGEAGDSYDYLVEYLKVEI